MDRAQACLNLLPRFSNYLKLQIKSTNEKFGRAEAAITKQESDMESADVKDAIILT